jgi:dynein heavy chain
VLYFCVVEMANINWMYNTSLYQFLELFDWGIDNAVKPPRIEDRVENIINCLTYKVYRYMNRIFFEVDKLTFKMLMCIRILIKRQDININDVNMLLKAGSAITGETQKQQWMEPKAANNLKALSMHRFEGENQPFFKDIFDRISRNNAEWKSFIEKQEPENEKVPSEYEDKI